MAFGESRRPPAGLSERSSVLRRRLPKVAPCVAAGVMTAITVMAVAGFSPSVAFAQQVPPTLPCFLQNPAACSFDLSTQRAIVAAAASHAPLLRDEEVMRFRFNQSHYKGLFGVGFGAAAYVVKDVQATVGIATEGNFEEVVGRIGLAVRW